MNAHIHGDTRVIECTPPRGCFRFDGFNEGDMTMIALFALAMMTITAGFAVPALLPARNSR